jgi:Mn-dependent DtxR family transcriptional regulator
MLAGHLLNHEGTQAAVSESRPAHLSQHLRWSPDWAQQVVQQAQRDGVVVLEDEQLLLTPQGRARAKASLNL